MQRPDYRANTTGKWIAGGASLSRTPQLTPEQSTAVDCIEGPVLVLAGPGSGKTRVITSRIARMLAEGIPARGILAITFTNKAAREMAERVQRLAPGSSVWISTFHKFCAYLLRRFAPAVGREPNFSILDSGDQVTLIRQSMRELDIDPIHYPPARVAQRISRLKNDLVFPAQYVQQQAERIGDHFAVIVGQVYAEYQARLQSTNSVDFDDLLLLVIQLLQENPELRSDLDARYRYVMVDEYQDTNRAQYELAAALATDYRNVCVTGDPDQSIYGWRGARIENILRFERDYPEARVVRLEQNFRSTPAILDAADRLICHNTQRKHKGLKTDNPDGPPVQLAVYRDGIDEAENLAQTITAAVQAGNRKWSDFAVFYRVNSLSRQLETTFARLAVPYQVAAGTAFYDRAEIKDLVAFLRLVNNPQDDVAFLRIVNTPARGIGKVTLQKLQHHCRQQGIGLLTAAKSATQLEQLSARARKALASFAQMVEQWRAAADTSVEKLLQRIISESHYIAGWQTEEDEQSRQRLANVHELVSAARQYDLEQDERGLEGFLETCSLVGDVDSLESEAGTVTLMTLHAAKGLEFPVVYVLGVEENLIPHERALKTGQSADLEEERRLLFVGITRAREELTLTQTVVREIHGRTVHTIPSQFTTEAGLKPSYGEWDTQAAAAQDEAWFDPFSDEHDSAQADPAPSPVASNPSAGLRLMRASDLLQSGGAGGGSAAGDVQLPSGFAIGMRVRHPRYGRGVVTQIGGMSRHRTVTVEFESDDRTETFVASKCPLQPIGEG